MYTYQRVYVYITMQRPSNTDVAYTETNYSFKSIRDHLIGDRLLYLI